jgi:hypothetical protein
MLLVAYMHAFAIAKLIKVTAECARPRMLLVAYMHAFAIAKLIITHTQWHLCT